MSTLYISFQEAFRAYGIKVDKPLVNKGYKFASDTSISKREIEKIQRILGTYRRLEIVESQRGIREGKFNLYIAHKPREEWEGEAEYSLYTQWQDRLQRTQTAWAEVSTEFQIREISIF